MSKKNLFFITFIVLIFAGYFAYLRFGTSNQQFSAESEIDGRDLIISDENYLNTISEGLNLFKENGAHIHTGDDVAPVTMEGITFILSDQIQAWPLVIAELEGREVWVSSFSFSFDEKKQRGVLTVGVEQELNFSENEYSFVVNRDIMMALHIIANWTDYPGNFSELTTFLDRVIDDLEQVGIENRPFTVFYEE